MSRFVSLGKGVLVPAFQESRFPEELCKSHLSIRRRRKSADCFGEGGSCRLVTALDPRRTKYQIFMNSHPGGCGAPAPIRFPVVRLLHLFLSS